MPRKKHILLFTVLAVTAAIVWLAVWAVRARSSMYAYDTRRDHVYDFRRSGAIVTDLPLRDGRVVLSRRHGSDHTAFLKVDVDAAWSGRLFQPRIVIAGEKRSVTQYLEHGAAGIRYLNISSLPPDSAGGLTLRGKYAAVRDQTVQLVMFRNPSPGAMKILVVAPHPDDAEIAAYGLYSDNRRSHIVTVTAGDAGPNNYDEISLAKARQYLKKGQLRTWNSITVPLLGGIPSEQIVNLGFFDATLASMYRSRSLPVRGRFTQASDISTFRRQNVSSLGCGLTGGADWHSLVANLEYLLRQIGPDAIVAPYPALDKHPDHKLSSIALFEAIRKAGMTRGRLYLYTNHFVLNAYYPYGEAGSAVTLPPNSRKPVYFDGIYSHALSHDKQVDKLFALEAMNDLRLDTEWRFAGGAVGLAIASLKRDASGKEKSYFRSAVRSNELFFVVEIENLYNEKILNEIKGEL
ncbi:PIG-L deacetylase family protein [Desulfococcus sp.]|uniref:PIG-L deacetylase family protein n=1 Tax=Desulfococcus sp. TaxID=2025834 RepID=UPI003594943E